MRRHLPYIVAAALLAFTARECSDKQERRLSPVLQEGERERISFDSRTKRVVVASRARRGKDAEGRSHPEEAVRQIDGVRRGSFVLREDGTTEQVLQTKGWFWGPGFTSMYSDRLRFGVDYELGWWKRWSLVGGLTVGSDRSVRGHLAGAYNVYQNTSVALGIDHKKEICFGVRVSW